MVDVVLSDQFIHRVDVAGIHFRIEPLD